MGDRCTNCHRDAVVSLGDKRYCAGHGIEEHTRQTSAAVAALGEVVASQAKQTASLGWSHATVIAVALIIGPFFLGVSWGAATIGYRLVVRLVAS